MEGTYVRLINCHFHLLQSSASPFSSQYLLLFLKISRSSVLLLPTTSYYHHLSFNSIMKETISSHNMPIQLAFLHRILFRSVLFIPVCSTTCSLVTFSGHFIFSNLFQHHISKLSNFLCVQASEPYKAMFKT
jgi:hypothetical protein